MRNNIKYIVSLSMALVSSATLAVDGRTVMRNALHAIYYQGDDQRMKVQMRIIDKQGRERFRELSMLRRNLDSSDERQKYYAYFSKPTDVKKMVFMAWKNIARGDDRWLYLPALDLVKRIAASDERTSFVGSHFFYEDISGRGLDEDNHQLIEENDRQFVIRSQPINADAVEFDHYRVWVDKKTHLPMKLDYYRNDAVYRAYRVLATSDIDGHLTVTKAQMEDRQLQGRTIVEYSSIKYSQGIPEKVFSERFLRRPPKQYFE